MNKVIASMLFRQDGDHLGGLIIWLVLITIGFTYMTFALWIPQAEADWQKEKSNIDSMSCKELGNYLVKHSTDYSGSDQDYSTAYKYADSKWHTGDCNG